jgi:hypothetical protein
MEATAQQNRLMALGISREDTDTLRRISMTLRRWFELECGDSNDYGSFAIERDETTGKPYSVYYPHTAGKNSSSRTPIADRETGARKRLATLMARYPGLTAYVQGDPRGCSLYILTAKDINGLDINSVYTRGVAVA